MKGGRERSGAAWLAWGLFWPKDALFIFNNAWLSCEGYETARKKKGSCERKSCIRENMHLPTVVLRVAPRRPRTTWLVYIPAEQRKKLCWGRIRAAQLHIHARHARLPAFSAFACFRGTLRAPAGNRLGAESKQKGEGGPETDLPSETGPDTQKRGLNPGFRPEPRVRGLNPRNRACF